ncbi:arsenate reductase family protein [Robertkochia flava]|uniref:arsenate reductase family protein n=1 Tax=Robertkochia flava TaxID=3447986 RepID=UPI001CCE207C|nr:hypothetical protein [Robertkochia marina]
MGEIATSDRQITLFCNPDTLKAKKTRAYALAEGLPILEVDIVKTPPTGTQIAELAAMLNMEIHELIIAEHPSLHSSGALPYDLSEEDWITMIRSNPEILKQPIAIRGKTAILVDTPSDIIRI